MSSMKLASLLSAAVRNSRRPTIPPSATILLRYKLQRTSARTMGRWIDRGSLNHGGVSFAARPWTRGTNERCYLPADTETHAGTIMCWPTEQSIQEEGEMYDGAEINATWAELAKVARTIAKYEPLHLFVDSSRGSTNLESAQALLGNASNVTIHRTTNVYSLWARDTCPIFVRSDSAKTKVVGLILSFNQWGRKLAPNTDMFLAPLVSEEIGVPTCLTSFIGEGGAIEVDGRGTMLATESSLLNPNRNPGMNKATLEQLLQQYLGVEKVIWLPGRAGWDITDDHIDSLARFGRPGSVLLSRPYIVEELPAYEGAKSILEQSVTHDGQRLTVIDLPEPDPAKVLGDAYDPEYGPCVSYANFYAINGAVMVPAFGDQDADNHAAKIIGEHFPGRIVEQVPLHQLAFQGGGMHCATQQIVAEI